MDEQDGPNELARLRRQNAELNEQIKLLVRTEQRLYRMRNTADQQLSRVQELARFNLDSAALKHTGQIVDRAMQLLQEGFDVDHVASVLDLGEQTLQLSWRLPDGTQGETQVARDEPLARAICGTQCIEIARPDEAFGGRYGALLDLVPALACALEQPQTRVVSMPLRSTERTFGLILASGSTESSGSYYRHSVSDSDVPFLQVLAQHLERALQSAAMTAELREQGAELSAANRQLRESLQHLERTQQQLLQSKKMEAIGRLAGGVAHDFNNLLTVILGHAQLLHDRLPASSPDVQDISAVIQAGTRAADIVAHLLAFSRKQRKSAAILDLNEVVRDLTRMLTRLAGGQITIEVRTDPEIRRIRADRAHLEQILMNLVDNARDAMPDGGSLVLSTRGAQSTDLEQLEGESNVENHVALTVSDTGQGMDQATRARVFEPFFTTKNQGHGTGMGLATVYGLVKQNEGHIEVTSEVGQGSSFTLLFPTVSEAERTSLNEPLDSLGTILLAEDEQEIRALFARVLRDEGYEVIEAADGAEGLDRAAAHEGPIDLVICDVVMPGIGGDKMVRRLKRTRPEIPVLFISGYAFDSLNVPAMSNERYLQKPFMPAVLLAKVHEILKRKRFRIVGFPAKSD